MSELPEGFVPHFRRSPLTEPWEPIFSRTTETAVVIGLRAGPAHLNSRGLVHGGMMTCLADNAMGLSCGLRLSKGARLLTANLSIDFLGIASPGQWMQFETTFVRPGRTLCFAQAFVTANGEICARANGVFRVVEPKGTAA